MSDKQEVDMEKDTIDASLRWIATQINHDNAYSMMVEDDLIGGVSKFYRNWIRDSLSEKECLDGDTSVRDMIEIFETHKAAYATMVQLIENDINNFEIVVRDLCNLILVKQASKPITVEVQDAGKDTLQ